MIEHPSSLDGTGMRFAIVAARFNDAIVRQLVIGADETLRRHGVDADAIELTWVPGAFELPLAAKSLAASGRFNAVLCLGAVIRGATPHFDYVSGQAASGIAQVALDSGVPTIFGVLTTNTIEQAIERSGTKAGNKGDDTARAAIEMAQLVARTA